MWTYICAAPSPQDDVVIVLLRPTEWLGPRTGSARDQWALLRQETGRASKNCLPDGLEEKTGLR